MEAVYILPRIHRGDGAIHANLRRERLLHEDAVDLRIRIQPRNFAEQARLGDRLREFDRPVGQPHLLGGLAFHLHI